MSKANEFTVTSHFEGKDPIVREIYDQLIETIKGFGPIVEEPKKTSIHIVHRERAGGRVLAQGCVVANRSTVTRS